ncbi:DUF551 domain-containing protein [Escherichia coli]|nr:DUF551 domain-containing protein [Escherichia coli]EFH1453893.1 DUF551 domain-containing protein [Escherichia coli]EFM9685381.1 DUF551 domain-containing protein [Escherichia coli]
MTTITKERLLTIKQWRETYGPGSNVVLPAEEAEELARIALASLEADPVKRVNSDQMHRVCLEANRYLDKYDAMAKEVNKLLGRIAPPAPVFNGEYGDAYQGAREDLSIWKRRALEADEHVRRLEQINDHMVKEAQGESRMGEPVIREPAPVVPEEATPENVEMLSGYVSTYKLTDSERDIAAEIWNACRAAMLQGSQPVSQTYKFPVNTPCQDAPAHIWLQTAGVWPEDGELSELTWCSHNQHHDDTLYVRADLVNGNSPVTPDGWISCSERMPAQDDWILIYSKHGEYMAGQVQGEYVELSDGTLSWLGNALFWMLLPEPPQEAGQ